MLSDRARRSRAPYCVRPGTGHKSSLAVIAQVTRGANGIVQCGINTVSAGICSQPLLHSAVVAAGTASMLAKRIGSVPALRRCACRSPGVLGLDWTMDTNTVNVAVIIVPTWTIGDRRHGSLRCLGSWGRRRLRLCLGETRLDQRQSEQECDEPLHHVLLLVADFVFEPINEVTTNADLILIFVQGQPTVAIPV